MKAMTRLRARFRAIALVAVAVVLITGGLTTPAAATVAAPDAHAAATASSAAALSGSDFVPGMIISDAQFYQRNAMTQAEIQAFLDTKIGACSNGRCLNMALTDTFTRAADRNICDTYIGQLRESVATIIYKVQQACGISAKVLLVTLQKEQGLITDRSPSEGELRIAMGYGCPDTAPCDSEFYGLFNQIYKAAWQFKRYSTPTQWGSYQPGWNTIRYNPNADCGSKSVYIQNNATAALYNYTPYTPNDDALASLYAATPPCGSYGNRNFWVFYTTWFGSTLAGAGLAAIANLYQANGGASGPLGAQVATTSCAASAYSCYQNYQHGVIYWSAPFGAFAVSGTFGDYYRASGGVTGPLGPPTTAYTDIIEPASGDGFAQGFATGYLYSSVAGLFSITGKMQTAFTAAGWVRGPAGWPIGVATCTPGAGCSQPLQRGTIYSSGAGAFVLAGDADTRYKALGGPTGPLGYPSTVRTDIAAGANGDGTAQGFAGGYLYSSTSGYYAVIGAFQAAFVAAGWVRGPMGWPTADRICGTPATSCWQTFQNGGVSGSTAGTFVLDRTFRTAYETTGGPTGRLGYTTTAKSSVSTSANGNGFAQGFRGGYIYSSPAGQFAVIGPMEKAFEAAGWVRGSLGWPIAAEVCATGGSCSQAFQGGTLFASPTSSGPGTGFAVTDPGISAAYQAAGGPAGILGYPATATASVSSANGNGLVQGFQGGYLYSSAAGVFAVTGSAEKAFEAAGWVRGSLGWPTAAAVCGTDGGCTQAFQGGTVFAPASGAGSAISDVGIAAAYQAAGGPTGVLGYPVTMTASISSANGNGLAQGFQGGYIYSSTAGQFAVTGSMQTALVAGGWVRGSLGWPTETATCGLAGGGCSQQFQGGMIFALPSGGGGSIGDSRIATAYQAAGGPGGPLGYPVTTTAAIASPNGNGLAQGFQGGYIYSSASGSFAVTGPMEKAFEAAGWVRGSLGWPTAVATCTPGPGCSQQFQGGTLTTP